MLRQRDPAPQFSEGLLKFVEALATNARRQLRDFVAIDPETRMKTQVIDLIITIMVGMFSDRVLTAPEGLDAINHIDCKEWLLKHGAVAESVDSAFVTGLYDLAFCYADGDRAKPQLAAGQALRGALRMFFSYRGAIFWRMRGGMGETVFSPLFRVLRRRDVKFRFLHSLTDVQFKADPAGGMRVAELKFDVVTGGEGFADDRPLDHFGCWRHDRPPTRDGRPRRLVDGRDFDAVIFAMGFDDFNAICGPRLRDQRDAKVRRLWENMLSTTKTVATQAAQVWMTKDLAGLGWQRGPILVSALEEPFETWADMTHTLAAERAWRAHRNAPARATGYGTDVKSIAYFCGVLPDSVVQKLSPPDASFAQTRRALNEKIVADLDDLLANRMDFLWPAAYPQDPRRRAHARRSTSPLRFLATAHGTAGGKLWDQHLQASFHRSDRYTLAVPGSLEYRISPLRRLVDNMTIAGDWTECGFNEGCIEAAVMSGMLAAHAISGQPDLNDIVGYNHP